MDAILQSLHEESGKPTEHVVSQLEIACWGVPPQEVTAVVVRKSQVTCGKRWSVDCTPRLPKSRARARFERKPLRFNVCAKRFDGCACFVSAGVAAAECSSKLCINKAINSKTLRRGSGALFANREVRLEKYNKLGLYRDALKDLQEPVSATLVSKKLQRRGSVEATLLKPRVPFQSPQFRRPTSPRTPGRRPFDLQRLEPLSF